MVAVSSGVRKPAVCVQAAKYAEGEDVDLLIVLAPVPPKDSVQKTLFVSILYDTSHSI